MKNTLFSPWNIKGLELKNRVVMAPMDQYSAENGYTNTWHTHHYTARAIGQVGLIILEVAAVSAEARIDTRDLGIYKEGHVEGLAKIVAECHKYDSKVALQIGHAGRKGMPNTPLLAPSSLPFSTEGPTPEEMDQADIARVILDFKQAAMRAKQAGFDALEIHAAHGYLLSSFLSPLSNQRDDIYGKQRALLLQEILEAIKTATDLPLLLRISATDHHPQGNTPEKMVTLLEPLNLLYDALDVSSGGVVKGQQIKPYPGYQIPHAMFLKEALNKPTIGGGMIDSPHMAQKIISNGCVDAIFLGRALLQNPFWCLNAAHTLGQEIKIPEPYARMFY
ncbi:oxidoreductase [Helicobacter salomonis]|uniref:oxidoreductase n=1 Tax=Helicobacter salomonis TaxID=56878 RepID=UPI000CF14EA2|nr:NADPH dehydrogenase [Helicobacter salomonis]